MVAAAAGEPVKVTSTGNAPASRSAAPAPWTQRAAIRNARLPAAAHAIEAARKSTIPTASTRAARSRWTNGTRAIATAATATLYEVSTHETPSIEVSRRP